MTKLFLGIDLGGSKVKLAIIDSNGNIIEQSSFSNSYESIPKDVVNQTINNAKSMRLFKKVSGTGVGVPGDIDQKNGIVRFSPNLMHWKNVNLKDMFKSKLPSPIVIENDANAAAWGAYWLDGHGKVKNLICITLGTGVGCGIILDGKIYRGTTGSAGEIGHITLDPSGPRCNCGNYGCIERYIGAPFLTEEAKHIFQNNKSDIVMKLVNNKLENITPHILTLAAQQDDPIAKSIWEKTGERLGIILAGVINLLNPEVIVLAGGMSKAGKFLLKPIKDTVMKRAFEKPATNCKIIISKYTQRLGVVGAGLLTK